MSPPPRRTNPRGSERRMEEVGRVGRQNELRYTGPLCFAEEIALAGTPPPAGPGNIECAVRAGVW